MPKSHLPQWLRSYVTDAHVEVIEAAVQTAESKTHGEIVPMIVHRSTPTGHIPVLLFLTATSFFLTSQLWSHHWLSFVIYFIASVLCLFSEKSDFLCRILTSRSDQALLVEQRALREFYQHRVHHTERSTGILIFLSVMEHRAVVLGDEPIAQKVTTETWNKIIQVLISGIKKNQTIEGLREAIIMSGQLLKEHFPVDSNQNKDELSNTLIIKE